MNIDILTLPTMADIVSPTGWTSYQKRAFVENYLNATGRTGIEKIIDFLSQSDFYSAPSSQNNHSNYEGGLLDHSILVMSAALRYRESFIAMNPALEEKLPIESVVISTLLHDVCKTGFYRQTVRHRKGENGLWESYIGYDINDMLPIGHGEKSVIMLLNFGLDMTMDEMLAIRYHMGAWDGAMLTNDLKYSYYKAIDQCPLITLIQLADVSSSLLYENNIVPNKL